MNTPDYFEISAAGATTVEQAIACCKADSATGKEVIFVAGANDGFLLINTSGVSAVQRDG